MYVSVNAKASALCVVVVVVVVVRQNNQGNPAFDQQIREASGQVYDDG